MLLWLRAPLRSDSNWWRLWHINVRFPHATGDPAVDHAFCTTVPHRGRATLPLGPLSLGCPLRRAGRQRARQSQIRGQMCAALGNHECAVESAALAALSGAGFFCPSCRRRVQCTAGAAGARSMKRRHYGALGRSGSTLCVLGAPIDAPSLSQIEQPTRDSTVTCRDRSGREHCVANAPAMTTRAKASMPRKTKSKVNDIKSATL